MNRSKSWKGLAALMIAGTIGCSQVAMAQCDQALTASDGAAGDRFGEAIDFDGTTLIVGAPYDDFTGRADAGSAYIFTGTGLAWSQVVKLVAPDGLAGDHLGTSVSVYGAYAAVGSTIAAGPSATFCGAVYLWHRDAGGTWSYLTKITAPDAASGDQFGKSVCIYNDLMVVGAPGEDNANGFNSGSMYVFRNVSGTTWAFQEKIIAGDGVFNDGFGWSVAVNELNMAASAYYADTNGHNSNGTVYTYRRADYNSPFTFASKVSASDAYDTAGFGNVVRLTYDRMYVADQLATVGGQVFAGKVYSYARGINGWTETAIGVPTSPVHHTYLGSSLATDGSRLVIGGFGKAGVFAVGYNSLTQERDVTDPSLTPDDQFGSSVGIRGNTLFIGDKNQSPVNQAYMGNAHVFQMTEQSADTCDTAAPLYPSYGVVACLQGNTPSSNMAGICGSSAQSPDVFYTFMPTCSGTFTFRTLESNFDTVVSVHSACPATAANAIGCDDDGGPLHTSVLTVNLTANTRYYIRVAGYQGAAGMYRLVMTESYPAPSNDSCQFATAIGTGSFTYSTCGATDDPGVYSSCSNGRKDIWYRLTAPCAGIVSVDLCQSNYDTTLDIFPGSCLLVGNQPIRCNDDACNYQSRVSFFATQGTQYLIRVGGWLGESGSGTMVTSCNPCPCNWNHDAVLNSQDFFDFLSAFFQGNADYNLSGSTNSQDFFDFLSCFFTGC